jgi:hypothetical protein
MRSLQTLHDGATYHVTSKIDHDDMSLLEPRFKKLFLSFVKKAKRIIKGMGDFLRVREYIAENPVKAGHVERAAEWMFGSLYHQLHRTSNLLDDVVSDTFDGVEI